jgi:hypothetical protein
MTATPPEILLEQLTVGMAPGETRTHEPPSVEVDPRGEFFVIRPNYNHPVGRFEWVNQPDLSNYPRRETIYAPKRPVGDWTPFDLQFDGSASEALDYYDRGPISFVSDQLLAIIREHDPTSLDSEPAKLRCRTGDIAFNAFMPMRAFVAADLTTTKVTVRALDIPDKLIASFLYPVKYRVNPRIPRGVAYFADLAEPKMYWSRRLVEACAASEIKGISAQTTYATEVETIQL